MNILYGHCEDEHLSGSVNVEWNKHLIDNKHHMASVTEVNQLMADTC